MEKPMAIAMPLSTPEPARLALAVRASEVVALIALPPPASVALAARPKVAAALSVPTPARLAKVATSCSAPGKRKLCTAVCPLRCCGSGMPGKCEIARGCDPAAP